MRENEPIGTRRYLGFRESAANHGASKNDARIEREGELASDRVEEQECVAPCGVDLGPFHLNQTVRQRLSTRKTRAYWCTRQASQSQAVDRPEASFLPDAERVVWGSRVSEASSEGKATGKLTVNVSLLKLLQLSHVVGVPRLQRVGAVA